MESWGRALPILQSSNTPILNRAALLRPKDVGAKRLYLKIRGELDIIEYQYDPKAWRRDATEKDALEIDLFDRYWAEPEFSESPWYEFQEAVESHRDLALRKFKPLFEEAGLAILAGVNDMLDTVAAGCYINTKM